MAELIRQVGISEETCISGKRSTGVGGRSSAADQATAGEERAAKMIGGGVDAG